MADWEGDTITAVDLVELKAVRRFQAGDGPEFVAVARKPAVLLHSLWRSGGEFRWPEAAAPSAAA